MLLTLFLFLPAASQRAWIHFGVKFCGNGPYDFSFVSSHVWTFPSVVAFRNDTVLSGRDALAPGAASPANTITGIRNLIGLRYSDDVL
jgi:molecular chaperone DnaK (HSP70)